MLLMRLARLERGYSQRVLSYAADVPQPLLCLVERGERALAPDQLARVADVLNVSPPEALMTQVLSRHVLAALKEWDR